MIMRRTLGDCNWFQHRPFILSPRGYAIVDGRFISTETQTKSIIIYSKTKYIQKRNVVDIRLIAS